jgi:hypothetical protein
MHHENIVCKVDYEDGNGTGAVIWRLGQGRDDKAMTVTLSLSPLRDFAREP